MVAESGRSGQPLNRESGYGAVLPTLRLEHRRYRHGLRQVSSGRRQNHHCVDTTSTRRCSAHCWYAQQPLCRCTCQGSSHGLLAGGEPRLLYRDFRRSSLRPRYHRKGRTTTVPMNLRLDAGMTQSGQILPINPRRLCHTPQRTRAVPPDPGQPPGRRPSRSTGHRREGRLPPSQRARMPRRRCLLDLIRPCRYAPLEPLRLHQRPVAPCP